MHHPTAADDSDDADDTLRAAVGIVGLGHVGTALAQALQAHRCVLRCDPALADSQPPARLARACGIVFVCVPTPAGAGGAADMSIVEAVVAELAEHTKERAGDQAPLVVIKSTVPPGTTQTLAARHPWLPIVMCPEFMREQTGLADLLGASRFVIGLPTPAPPAARLALLHAVLRTIAPAAAIVTTSAATAELVKYATNAFLAMKVVFANQMADACAALDLDYPAFAQALALDPRIGASHLGVPGADGMRGFGGRCLPKDLEALLAALGPQLPLLQAVANGNEALRQRGNDAPRQPRAGS